MNYPTSVLSGIKVVELASVLAGPSVGMFLAELGATVTKVENPMTGGDTTRKWKTGTENQDAPVSSYYASANWGKSVITLDYNKAADFQKIITLIKDADILLYNFKPGDEFRYGLDFGTLKTLNPRLILGHISGFPEDERPAFDIVLQAETGFMDLNGSSDGGALKWPLPIVDILAAHQLKEGILLALIQRQNTGFGICVKVSLFDAAVASLFNIGTNVIMGNSDPRMLGPVHPNIAPYGETLLSSDGHLLVLAVGTDSQFASLCSVLNANPDFQNKFSTNTTRVRDRTSMANVLFSLGKALSLDELTSRLTLSKVPFGRIKTVKSVIDSLPDHYFLREIIEAVDTKRMRSTIFTFQS